MQHFIVEFKHALSADYCQKLITKFEQDTNKQQGRIGSGVDTSKKNSIDIHLSTLPHWQQEHQDINGLLLQGLVQYVKAYPHMITGAISPSIKDEKTGQLVTLTHEMIPQLDDARLATIIQLTCKSTTKAKVTLVIGIQSTTHTQVTQNKKAYIAHYFG